MSRLEWTSGGMVALKVKKIFKTLKIFKCMNPMIGRYGTKIFKIFVVPILKVLDGKDLDIVILFSILEILHAKDKQQNLHV